MSERKKVMEKIRLDKIYELECISIVEESEKKITVEVSFDLNVYPHFYEYCKDKVISNEKVWLDCANEIYFVHFIGCSFTLGVISYDDNEEIESIDTRATGILNFER